MLLRRACSLLLLAAFFGNAHAFRNADALDEVPPRGGLPLTDVVLGRSSWGTPAGSAFRSEPYFFFVLKPETDNYVSNALLNSVGGWEPGLNSGFTRLLDADRGARALPVLDVGANFGAFSLYVASLGLNVWAFEMQPRVHTLLELSRRVNEFHRMRLFHAALWNESGVEVTFTPQEKNLGGTTLIRESRGTVTMKTRRLDEIFTGHEVFFMKIDVENSEEWVLKGMDRLLSERRVRHFVMEHRRNQAHLMDWFYSMGYTCGTFDAIGDDAALLTLDGARQQVLSLDIGDIYCKAAPHQHGFRRAMLSRSSGP